MPSIYLCLTLLLAAAEAKFRHVTIDNSTKQKPSVGNLLLEMLSPGHISKGSPEVGAKTKLIVRAHPSLEAPPPEYESLGDRLGVQGAAVDAILFRTHFVDQMVIRKLSELIAEALPMKNRPVAKEGVLEAADYEVNSLSDPLAADAR
mmetsp:Transcript_29139/g.65230  ORF Transcript_29139/g.65230 Transcript_29139/m.65230 type:complete len:148 (-) Transcript_29139:1321-1764(-)